MTQIKGLLFDKDGTLFDFAATWEAWAQAFLLRLADGDRVKATQTGALIGFNLTTGKFARDSIVIAGTPDQIAAVLMPHFPNISKPALMAVLNAEAAAAPQREAVPLTALLSGLRDRGLKLGVATNDAEAPARAHLAAAGVTELFDFIAGSDSGHGGKPSPGQMLAFAAQTGLEPSTIAMVGDSTHDLHAGRAAGMTAIAVLTGLAGHDDLAPHADVVLPDIGHLPQWLDSLGR
ncbi:phosphoglycolate phosphatase [Sulfitobacter brevis]|uniref:phosphoglycolate phosphatase n=1 Tax=Sulfitobacter brevis TaxID=74348 RepID=A0A1I2AR47_9RHOB|nr:HAD family hydrolase [Sulfitobacter brevis]SFE45483.1 phosphoglycolate phosphatase [Sulfitobacter brevis]